jgi:hypothetical protein
MHLLLMCGRGPGPGQAGVVDYEALKAAMVAGDDAAVVRLTARTAEVALQRKATERYSLARLVERPLPEGVDAAQLELFLREEDFPAAFGVTHAEFLAMPKWKRDGKKKESKLF